MRETLAAIRKTAADDPARIAISERENEISYGELAKRIAAAAASLSGAPERVGLMMPRDGRAIVADLALASLGRTIVPLPSFFSPEQWQHMIADAQIGALVTTPELAEQLTPFGLPLLHPDETGPGLEVQAESRRIIYTSGTTGRPKGVITSEAAMAASVSALTQAALAGRHDVHLSVLPFSLLLEQLAGIMLPLSLGARLHILADPRSMIEEASAIQPTTSVLVPELLRGWTGWLRARGARAPASLRFVAVGGAPVPQDLADQAWSVGLPVYEGYGLSECCSVVAVNRPGHRRAGTVGRPIEGVHVDLQNGEIVVRGPTVMQGYLGHAPAGGQWRSGDLGRWDDEGNLIVLGRKDDMIVTPAGRNIHPEWIEPMLAADPRVERAAAVLGPRGLTAVIVTDQAAPPEGWLAAARRLTTSAPDYARPRDVAVLTGRETAAAELFTADGRPRRKLIRQHINERHMRFYDALLAATAEARREFLAIPLIAETLAHGVDIELYRDFLRSAYHHVRYTVPLMEAALGKCGNDDDPLAQGLCRYIDEEIGHDAWILDDIAALGGDAETARRARPPLATGVMVAYAFHLIAEDGPYALLGMVHVLESVSAALATQAAKAIQQRLQSGAGFRYLASHGDLDNEHVAGYADLLDAIDTPARRETVIAAAKDFYRLYGDMFRELGAGDRIRHAS